METKMPPKVAGALVKAAREANAVEKKGTVKTSSYSYRFAGADALMSEAREALAGAGLAIVLTRWWPEVVTVSDHDADGKPVSWLARTLFATFLLVHEEGDSHEVGPFQMPVIEERGRGLDKADAASLTYLTGYVMRGLLNLPRVEEGSQVDERDDSERRPRSARREPTAEERAAAILAEIEEAVSTSVDLVSWCGQYGAKAVRAVGMERLQPILTKRAKALEVDEGAVQAAIAKAVAAAKKP